MQTNRAPVPEEVISLQPFFDAGVLTEADVHVTATLMRASGFTGSRAGARAVQLATALAVRAPRNGHVCVDLATVADSVVADTRVLDHHEGTVDPLADLVWPELKGWLKHLTKAAALVRDGSAMDMSEAEMARTALVLTGTSLYLDRYFTYEHQVAEALRLRAKKPARSPVIGHPGLIEDLFGSGSEDRQRQAALAIASIDTPA